MDEGASVRSCWNIRVAEIKKTFWPIRTKHLAMFRYELPSVMPSKQTAKGSVASFAAGRQGFVPVSSEKDSKSKSWWFSVDPLGRARRHGLKYKATSLLSSLLKVNRPSPRWIQLTGYAAHVHIHSCSICFLFFNYDVRFLNDGRNRRKSGLEQ